MKKYDTVTFGHYMQDREGTELAPLSWRILDKKDGTALLIAEKIVDLIQFSSENDNDWERSDIKKWLNTDFADTAFSEQEKALIEGSVSGRVLLLSLEEYKTYFSNFRDAWAVPTDYCRKKEETHCRQKIDRKHSFW